jgi:hypothetical protein
MHLSRFDLNQKGNTIEETQTYLPGIEAQF